MPPIGAFDTAIRDVYLIASKGSIWNSDRLFFRVNGRWSLSDSNNQQTGTTLVLYFIY
jgi:hypothetical protein